MSKFLKFIVHFIVICTIACVVGLAVPPFLGITTEIMDDTSRETNLPMGSVTYAIPVKTEEAAIGDSILYQSESEAYSYMITEMDKENNTFTVINLKNPNSDPITVQVKDYIPKVVVTIGWIGYLLLATESIEGLIIVGLAVLFLIILYIIAELCKKEPKEEYEEEELETGYVKSKKELKREEKERARRYKEEEREIKREDKQRKKGKKQERKKVKTGGFVDEIYEDELDMEKVKAPQSQPKQTDTVDSATSEAHELLKKEIAAATADEPEEVKAAESKEKETYEGKTEIIVPQVKETLKQMMQESERVSVVSEEDETAQIRRMAIPSWSAAQIAEIAKNQGDAPDIVKDDVTKVTLFDYSDIVADEKPLPTESQE